MNINILFTILLAFFNFIIAVYGALLSTALLIHEILKERKQLSIILEHVAWYETVQVIITNIGRRPITLVDMYVKPIFGSGDNSYSERVPRNALFGIDDPFPVKINDGEAISIPLGSVLAKTLIDNQLKAKIIIYDSQGKEYSDLKSRIYDAKKGGYFDSP